MSALVGTGRQTVEARRTAGGYAWFALMVGGWVVFFSLIAFSPETLAGLYADLRGLPILVELLAWFLTFPFAFALTIWESSWDSTARWVLVACIALAWSAMFFSRKRSVVRIR